MVTASLPLVRPAVRCRRASAAWSSGYMVSTAGLMMPWSTRSLSGSSFRAERDRPHGWWISSRRSRVGGTRSTPQTVDGLTSDAVLAALAPALAPLGYRVKLGKRVADRIHLPMLFGDGGRERVAYEVDAFQEDLGIVVDIDAGRGARGNAVYRDLIRASLLLDARLLA